MKTARKGDQVNMNCPHGAMGTIITGSEDCEVNGKQCARETDTVQCNLCGVTRTINAGECSPDTYLNGLQVARLGDPSTGICDLKQRCCPHTTTATIAEGSSDTLVNAGE